MAKSWQQSPQKSSSQANKAAPSEANKFQWPSKFLLPQDCGMMDGADIHLTWKMTGPGEWQGRGRLPATLTPRRRGWSLSPSPRHRRLAPTRCH